MAGLAVSLIACPCALGLATPLAVWSAIGQAASHQVLFRSGEALERLAEIGAVRFDKTGTLTTGTAAVASRLPVRAPGRAGPRPGPCRGPGGVARRMPSRRRSCDLHRARPSSAPPRTTRDQRSRRARAGVVGMPGRVTAPNTSISLGSPLLMDERGLHLGPVLDPALEQARDRGLSMALVGWDGEARGLFVFDEQWRPGFDRVIAWLKRARPGRGRPDRRSRRRGARRSPASWASPSRPSCLPDQKVAAIHRAHGAITARSRWWATASTTPLPWPPATSASRWAAAPTSRAIRPSICLLGDDLTRIPWTIELARRTIRVIRQNLFWAFAYNTVGVIAAALGWLNPALAALLMVASSAHRDRQLAPAPAAAGARLATGPLSLRRVSNGDDHAAVVHPPAGPDGRCTSTTEPQSSWRPHRR